MLAKVSQLGGGQVTIDVETALVSLSPSLPLENIPVYPLIRLSSLSNCLPTPNPSLQRSGTKF